MSGSAGAPGSLPEAVSVRGNQEITADKTFSGDNTFSGTNTFTGSTVFSGTTTDEGAQTIAPAVSASGTPSVPLTVTAAADTAITTATESNSVYFNLSATRQWATGALTTQRAFRIAAPTYAFVGASTITTAVTLDISGAPTAGTNATITNSYAFRVAGGASLLVGAVAMSSTLTVSGATVLSPTLAAGGARVALTVTGAADTTNTTTVEVPDQLFNGARTVQWATGAITSQRFTKFMAPTIAFVGASTVTNAATLYVDAAPTAGTNATITNNYAMWVDAGRVRFDGPVVQNDYPVINNTGTVGVPVTTINTPTGITVVANGATSVAVTCAACTAETDIVGCIMNATTNNVSLRAIIPGAGSFVVHVSGDPGASTAIIRVRIQQPGTGV